MTTVATGPRTRGSTIALGVLIALAGAVLMFWPGVTTLVLVAFLGLSIVLYGIHELVNAFADGSSGRGIWTAIIGVVAIVGGIAVFVTPTVSSIAVGVVIGVYWVAGGIIGIVAAIVDPGNRLVRTLVAVLSIVAGLVVLTQPGLSLVVLVWFSGVWMLAAGIVMAISALFGRGRRTLATS
jgi:uncharacterized membrane protein HdeD (DUF308 family)